MFRTGIHNRFGHNSTDAISNGTSMLLVTKIILILLIAGGVFFVLLALFVVFIGFLVLI